MKILGIETSCDETAVCLLQAAGTGPAFRFTTLGNSLLSQAKEHSSYGGVFPNLAKREHQRNLVPVLAEALRQANMLIPGGRIEESVIESLQATLEREPELYLMLANFLRNYPKPDIDSIAVTVGPGLEPALWVGINFAKALAHVWDVPVVPVNHMEGHVVIAAMQDGRMAEFDTPLMSLLISGGHTELLLSSKWMHYELIGATRDDAVGEAFDKVARLLGLGYPGGPEISRLASLARKEKLSTGIQLPRPMINTDDYDFSFAGLKTAVRRMIEAHHPLTDDKKKEIAREFEDAAAEVLVEKTARAVDEHGANTVLVSGGVSANAYIREKLAERMAHESNGTLLLSPPPALATDNALMIALAGYFRAGENKFADLDSLRANGNLQLAEKP